MKRISGYAAIAAGLCAWPMMAGATLIGDPVTLGHYSPEMAASYSTTVAAGDSDETAFYFSYPYGYQVNVEADSIFVDYSYVIQPGDSGTWRDTATSCAWSEDFTLDCTEVPLSFNGLRVSDLDDSSGNPLINVIVDTNMAGWDNSRLSWGSRDVWFDWKGLSFDSGTYLNAQLEFGGDNAAAPVPEPSTLLLLGAGLAGFAAFRRKLRIKA